MEAKAMGWDGICQQPMLIASVLGQIINNFTLTGTLLGLCMLLAVLRHSI